MKALKPADPKKIVDFYELLDKNPEFAGLVNCSVDKLKRFACLIDEENFDKMRGVFELYLKLEND